MFTRRHDQRGEIGRVELGLLRGLLGVGGAWIFSLLSAHAAVAAAGFQSHPVAPGVLQVGQIAAAAITESSGVVAARTAGGFWTHNDGGGLGLFAMDRTGQALGEFRISGATLHDWEDISSDRRGHLFIADTGNNECRRIQIAVHQIDEPDLTKTTTGNLPVTRSWVLRFSGKPFDCEALVIWREHGYLISKVTGDARAQIYRFALADFERVQTLELLGELEIESPVTGAAISPDGSELAIVAKNGAYRFEIQGAIERAIGQKPRRCKFRHEHVESCTFVPDGLLVTAESREVYLFSPQSFERKK